MESFIEHQDSCTVRRVQPELQSLQQACSSRTASSTSPSSDANFSRAPLPGLPVLAPKPTEPVFLYSDRNNKNVHPAASDHHLKKHNLELQLLPSSNSDENFETRLKLSIGSCDNGDHNLESGKKLEKSASESAMEATRLKEFANEQLQLAVAEKAYAEEARQEAKRQIEMAELEFANAKRIRQQAQAELEKAQALKEQATKKIGATMMQITCQACKQQFQASTATVAAAADETSLAMSYMSSATTEGEGE